MLEDEAANNNNNSNSVRTPVSMHLWSVPHFDFSDEQDATDVLHDSTVSSPEYKNSNNLPQSESKVNNEPVESQQLEPPQSRRKRLCQSAGRIYHQNSFLILVTCALLLAFAYPPLGAIYVVPHVTATWVAVIFIFFLAGMGIKTEEFSKAFKRIYFNTFVQVFNFMVVSGIVYGFTRFMLHVKALPESLADGMTIASTLSVSVNMGIILTNLVGGDEAAAVFDAAFGNFLGVFVSPPLIVIYLGMNATVDLGRVTLDLFLRVVLPLIVGQLLRNFFPPAMLFAKRHNKFFRLGQEFSLVFIIYTIFCETFLEGSDAGVGDIFIMIGCVLLVLVFLMALAWTSMLVLFSKEPKVQVVGVFACTHKTVSVGVPLITSIYPDSPLLGLYILPLLIWYPTQLVLGTALAPYLAKYVVRKEKELQQKEVSNVGSEDLDRFGNSKSTQ